MGWWIALAVIFVVAVVGLTVWARHARDIEDDSTYLREETPFTPFGQKFVNILRGRRD